MGRRVVGKEGSWFIESIWVEGFTVFVFTFFICGGIYIVLVVFWVRFIYRVILEGRGEIVNCVVCVNVWEICGC